MKSGFLTSEFWLTAGIAALGAYATLDPSLPVNVRVAAIAGAVLKAALYTVQRTKLKAELPPQLHEAPPEPPK